MSIKGRKPKPTKFKVLEGNPGRRSLNDNELEPPDEPIEPPSHLDEYALKEWHRVIPGLEAMGIIFALDIQILAAYCDSFSMWRKATEKIKEKGMAEETVNGLEIQNCYVGIANKAKVDMLRFAAEFGLSPSVRARIGFDIGKNKKSEFDGLLGKKFD